MPSDLQVFVSFYSRKDFSFSKVSFCQYIQLYDIDGYIYNGVIFPKYKFDAFSKDTVKYYVIHFWGQIAMSICSTHVVFKIDTHG